MHMKSENEFKAQSDNNNREWEKKMAQMKGKVAEIEKAENNAKNGKRRNSDEFEAMKEEMKKRKVDDEKMICKEHKRKYILYCIPCGLPLCRVDFSENHKKHDVLDLTEAAEYATKLLGEEVKDSEEKLTELKKDVHKKRNANHLDIVTNVKNIDATLQMMNEAVQIITKIKTSVQNVDKKQQLHSDQVEAKITTKMDDITKVSHNFTEADVIDNACKNKVATIQKLTGEVISATNKDISAWSGQRGQVPQSKIKALVDEIKTANKELLKVDIMTSPKQVISDF